MIPKNYFDKNGFIYGIESDYMFCGYSTACIKFTDFDEALKWVNEKTNTYRCLQTKTGAINCNLKKGDKT